MITKNIDKKDTEFTKEAGVKSNRLKAKDRLSGRAICCYGEFVKTTKQIKADLVFFYSKDTLIAMQYLSDLRNKKSEFVMDCHMLEMTSKNKLANFYRFLHKFNFSYY